LPAESIIFRYFPGLTNNQQQQIRELQPLYQNWNQKINVISRKDMEHFYERHVLHSLSIAKAFRFSEGQAVLDLGTGGGFPGIPLAILFPEVNFHLVDSIGKKIKVVAAVSESLGMQNVSTAHQRAEKVKGSYDFILTRAVAPAKKLWQWTNSLLLPKGGIIALKGGDLQQELTELNRPSKVISLAEIFEEEFFQTKKIVVIRK
jgi:16S rRNA (guanine527-N7)-methyltransferase